MSNDSKTLRGTHKLESAEGGTTQHTERKQVIEGHSLSKECRGRDESVHGKEASYWGAFTDWRVQKGGTNQHMERK